MINQTWNTNLYDGKHNFVTKYGEDLLSLLAPKPGMRVLDVGCGTGHLTQKIADCGADVIGFDASAEMIAKARAEYPALQWHQADARTFDFGTGFDAIFSNATLHWVQPAEAAVACMARALKPGGAFIVEFGGAGNMQHVTEAVRKAIHQTSGADQPHGWFFPSVGEYAALLEKHGLEVNAAWLFDRPTPLEGEDGMRNWMTMFGGGLFAGVSDADKQQVIALAEQALRETNYADAIWFADYRRIRVVAKKI